MEIPGHTCILMYYLVLLLKFRRRRFVLSSKEPEIQTWVPDKPPSAGGRFYLWYSKPFPCCRVRMEQHGLSRMPSRFAGATQSVGSAEPLRGSSYESNRMLRGRKSSGRLELIECFTFGVRAEPRIRFSMPSRPNAK